MKKLLCLIICFSIITSCTKLDNNKTLIPSEYSNFSETSFIKDELLKESPFKFNLLQTELDISNLNIKKESDFIGFFEDKLFFLNLVNETFEFYFYDTALKIHEYVYIDGSDTFAYTQPIIIDDNIYFARLKSINKENPFLAEVYSINSTSKEIDMIDTFQCSSVIDLKIIGDNLIVLSRENIENRNKSYLLAYDLKSNLQKRELVIKECIIDNNTYNGEQIICFGGTENILIYETVTAHEEQPSEEGDFIINYYDLTHNTLLHSIKLDNPINYVTGNLQYLITNIYSSKRSLNEAAKIYINFEKSYDLYNYDYFYGFRSSNLFLNDYCMEKIENINVLSTGTDVLLYSPRDKEYFKYSIIRNSDNSYSKVCYNGNIFAYAIYYNDLLKEIVKVEVSYNYSDINYSMQIPEELLKLNFNANKGLKLKEPEINYIGVINNKHIYRESSCFANRPYISNDIVYWSLENDNYEPVFETTYYPFIEEIILDNNIYILFSYGKSTIYELDIENSENNIIFETSEDFEFIDDFKIEQSELKFILKSHELNKNFIYNPISKKLIEN